MAKNRRQEDEALKLFTQRVEQHRNEQRCHQQQLDQPADQATPIGQPPASCPQPSAAEVLRLRSDRATRGRPESGSLEAAQGVTLALPRGHLPGELLPPAALGVQLSKGLLPAGVALLPGADVLEILKRLIPGSTVALSRFEFLPCVR